MVIDLDVEVTCGRGLVEICGHLRSLPLNPLPPVLIMHRISFIVGNIGGFFSKTSTTSICLHPWSDVSKQMILHNSQLHVAKYSINAIVYLRYIINCSVPKDFLLSTTCKNWAKKNNQLSNEIANWHLTRRLDVQNRL